MSFPNFTRHHFITHTYFTHIKMSKVNLKIIFVKKQKQTRERLTQGWRGGGHSFITEIAVFILETDYS